MIKRSYLDNTIVLFGESDGKSFQRSFTITRKINEGADGVTYEAYHEKSGKGILKEFYPEDEVLLLERDLSGRLGHNDDIKVSFEQFRKRKEAFLKSYEMLLNIRRKRDDRDLATFIPFFELYYSGINSDHYESTVYIWTPEPELETFDKICDEIHKHPHNRPEHKLVTVLRAIETLTKCICALHSAGIIHRDIKPSNFGFRKRRGEMLTQSISLFDIDSLCSVWTDNYEWRCTPGYTEPEAEFEECTNQTDIYSIGATLFAAIIVTEESEKAGFNYTSSFYEYISGFVADSELIQASEANSNPRLRKILSDILSKCLCPRSIRYSCCEELLEDIQEALFYALPAEVTKRSKAGERWVLSKADSMLDSNTDKNSFLAIQYHLYEHPLYVHLTPDRKTLRICIIGFDNYAQKFLDACLQTGQMRSASLEIMIIGAEIEDRTLYLKERPALGQFFSIDGKMVTDSYGKIIFRDADISCNSNHNADCAFQMWDEETPDYVFVSLGRDVLNSRTALLIKKNLLKTGNSCLVNFACEKDEYNCTSDILPVMVNWSCKKNRLHKEIERMAFNTHLVWEKSINLDYSVIRKEFKRKYNHDSCISSVISLKYKLYELGIDLDKVSLLEAAELFKSIVRSKNQQLKTELMWIEHRRWVTEKLLLGWKGMSDLSTCMTGKTKNAHTKEHVCIAKSRPNQLLANLIADSDNANPWRSLSSADLDKLDDLDKMSVVLHRLYENKAREIRRTSPANNSLIAGIRTLAADAGAVGVFNEWNSCVRSLWAGDSTKVRLYKGLEQALIDATSGFDYEKRRLLIQELQAFRNFFHPVITSMIPHDWKQEDAAFIDNIPFVLTYSDKTWLTIPFNSGIKASDRFMNISSAITINPEKIVFVCSGKNEKNLNDVENSFGAIIRLMESKRLRAMIDIVWFYNDKSDLLSIESMFRRCGCGRVKKVSFVDTNSASEWAQNYIKSTLKRNVNAFSAIEKNSSEQSKMLESLGIYGELPWYYNDLGEVHVSEESVSMAFEYMPRQGFLTVEDMLQLSEGSSITTDVMDYFDDYEQLLAVYYEMTAEWNELCSLVKKYSMKNDILASFERPDKKSLGQEILRYIIPSSSVKGTEKIIYTLIKRGFIEADSNISRYTTDAYAVNIHCYADQSRIWEKLLSNVYALGIDEAISLKISEDGSRLNILFDDLQVNNLHIERSRETEIWTLLMRLSRLGLLIALKKDKSGVSFTFASRQIKSLIMDESKIGEMKIYYSLKNSGKYDDVVLGNLDIKRSQIEASVKCCIAMEGFMSRIVTFSETAKTRSGVMTTGLRSLVEDACINSSIYSAVELL